MLSAGHRGLSTVDPSRSRQGITVGLWRDIDRMRVSFDVRRDAQARDIVETFTNTHTTWIFGPDTISLTQGRKRDSLPQTQVDTVEVSTRVEWPTTSLRTRLQWDLGRLALDFTFGSTIGSTVGNPRAPTADSLSSTANRRAGVRLWGRADVRVALNSFMEVVGGLASLPQQELGVSPARRVGVLGFAINGIPRVSRAPGASKGAARRTDAAAGESFESVRDEAGTVRLRLHMPKATNVELSSELTGWTAVPMQKSTGDWWELPVNSPAGVYRVNIRVDGGAWKAPPNVSTVRDEFGGQVGLVRIG
jgi:hypothetical protein